MMRPIDMCRPLFFAARHNRADIVAFLLGVGADPTAQMYFGDNFISVAATRNFPEVVAVLLRDPRVDVNALASRVSRLPDSFFPVIETSQMTTLLQKDGDSRSALHMAACYGHTSVIKLLLADPRLDVNAVASFSSKSISACTAHMIALGQGFTDIATLIENDARFHATPLLSTDTIARFLSSAFIWEKLDIRIPEQVTN
jgi:ankyrin repeat protein